MLRYRASLLRWINIRTHSDTFTRNHAARIVPLTVEERENAEKNIIRYIQGRNYRELFALRNCQRRTNQSSPDTKPDTVKKTSSICKLVPQLNDQLLRIGGRLRKAPIQQERKHQIIIPKESPVAKLVARHYHEMAGHNGLEHVLSLIRERYWIVGARRILKDILRSCVDCRKRQAAVGEQKMADLPEHRVTPDKPPFTFVGEDCFGPFLVKRVRSQVKRYGVLFTCRSIRAVYIEIVHSLETSSFLHALCRFIARRGPPEMIRSDNGTNFVGGEKEIQAAIKNWNQDKIHNFLTYRRTKWIFNPPMGSHFGGVWERCIRTVHKILSALLKQQTVDDECLHTLMYEVESIMNGRPSTKVSDDPNDLEALTPNHLLLLRPGPSLPPGVFDETDMYARRRWRQAQYLSNVFWGRWLKEYLPVLQRQKWNKSRRNLAPGYIVSMVDDTSPRSSWLLGRVIRVKQNSRDGFVRRVVLKTKSGYLERPVDKVIFLELSQCQ